METINTNKALYETFKTANSKCKLTAHACMSGFSTGTIVNPSARDAESEYECSFYTFNHPEVTTKPLTFILATCKRVSETNEPDRYKISWFNGDVMEIERAKIGRNSPADIMQARCQDILDDIFTEKPTFDMAIDAGIQDHSYSTPACGWINSYSGEVEIHLTNGTKWKCTGVPVRSTGSHAYDYSSGTINFVQILDEAVA